MRLWLRYLNVLESLLKYYFWDCYTIPFYMIYKLEIFATPSRPLYFGFLNENYDRDILNEIIWHKSDLTSDIVSGSEFAGDSPRLRQLEEFSDSIETLGKLSNEQKNKAIEKFKEMLKKLPYNNFK